MRRFAYRLILLFPLLGGCWSQTASDDRRGSPPRSSTVAAEPDLGERPNFGDQAAVLGKVLRLTAQISHLSIQSTNPVTIDGLSGYESMAEADDAKSGNATRRLPGDPV